jgi:hypothetical protein
MVMMAASPERSILTRRSMLLTLPLAAWGGAGVDVDLFLATECPISNRYVPELNRIEKLFQGQGVRFQAWFAEPRLEQKALERWLSAYQLTMPVRLDPMAREARRLGATVTPEAVVSLAGKIRYRGRIDDRYDGPGTMRKSASQQDLIAVVTELLAGKTFPMRTRKAWGCYIEGGG